MLASPHSPWQDRGWRRCWEDHSCRSVWPRTLPPAPPAEQPLQLLPHCNQLSLDIDLLQPTETEAPQSVPVLGLGEERFNPDLPLPHRLGRGLRRVGAPHALQIRLLKAAPDPPSAPRGGALRPERAGRTGRRRRLAHPPIGPIARREEAQRLVSRTTVGIDRGVVGEVRVPELTGTVTNCRQGNIGADPRSLDGGDVRTRPEFAVPDDLARSQLPAEARPPQEVEGWLVVLHLGRGHQPRQDDSGLAAVHHLSTSR